jgi:hypothetical protein
MVSPQGEIISPFILYIWADLEEWILTYADDTSTLLSGGKVRR